MQQQGPPPLIHGERLREVLRDYLETTSPGYTEEDLWKLAQAAEKQGEMALFDIVRQTVSRFARRRAARPDRPG